MRIREDTAKYLLNLDPASAHYDPKSRRSVRKDADPWQMGVKQLLLLKGRCLGQEMEECANRIELRS